MSRLPLLFLLSLLPALAQTEAPNALGVTMGHLHIFTRDPDAHKRLWIDVLGGRLERTGTVEWAMFPGVFVGFRPAESGGGTVGSVIDHLGFLVRDLAATKAKLITAGVVIEREMPETRQMFTLFPDNVRVEFSEDASLPVPIRHHHVHFASHEIDAMRSWYAKAFGAVPGMRSRFKAADLPGVNLTWNAAETAPAASKGRAMDHIGFEVADIRATCARLEAAGIKLDQPPTPLPQLGLIIAFLTDPWGVRIELTEGFARLR